MPKPRKAKPVKDWPPVFANVDPAQLKALDHLAVDLDETRAEFVRTAIRERIERLKKAAS